MAYTREKFKKIEPWFEAINQDLLKAPISIVLLVTDKCACKCHMCTHWKMKKFHQLDYETFYSIMKTCEDNGMQSAFLSGGDCFSWEHWERFLQDETLKSAIQITSPFIVPEGFSLDLLSRLKWLRVSWDAVTSETFKKIRRTDKLDKIKEDLKYIIDNKIIEDVGMTTCLQKDNLAELYEMGEFLANLGVKRWIVQPVNYNPELEIPQESVPHIGAELLREFGGAFPINNFDVLIEDFKTYNSAENIPCVIPRMEAFIDTRLRVWPCCNIAQDSFGDEERANDLLMGMIHHGPNAGEEFLKLWNERKNYLDKFSDFKKIHKLCEYTCKFKYFYYNLGFASCKAERPTIYI